MNNTAKATESSNIGSNETDEIEEFQNGNFQGKTMEQNTEQKHSMSLRLPMEWHKQMEQRAKELNAPVSYVYRMAISGFIAKHGCTFKTLIAPHEQERAELIGPSNH